MANGINIDTAGLGNLISGISTAAQGIRAAITGKTVIDENLAAQLNVQLEQIETSNANAQAAIDAAEAASPSFFNSGWRPAVGWLCVIALLLNYFVFPILKLFKIDTPIIQLQDLIGLLVGMLGLTASRTVEKINNVQGNH